MTTYSEATEGLYNCVNSIWDNRTPLIFENEDYSPTDASWARFTVRHTGGAQDTLGSIGSRQFIRTGICIVQIFTPSNEGRGEADGHLDSLVSLEGKSIAGTTVKVFSARVEELPNDGKWFQVNISFGFQYRQTH